MAKINAGYEIRDTVSISGKHYVMGQHQNPQAPAPFVTWETDDQQKYFYQGHYFTDRNAAQLDLLKRSSQALDLGDQTIGKALLTQQDRLDLQREFYNASALEDIAAVLGDEAEYLGQQYDLDALMEDPQFISKAMRIYNNQDHSYENEALRDALSPLLEEFTQYQIPELENLTTEQKISPELYSLITELLNTPSAQVPEKLGPLGDNISFELPLSNGMKVTVDIVPTLEIYDNYTLSQTEPHHVYLELLDAEGNHLHSEIQMAKDFEGAGLPGDFHISYGDLSITATIEEDETLRRVGNQFVYQANTESEPYQDHNGELCTIQRTLTPKECDVLCTGLMYEAKFSNGDVMHVFDEELSLPEKDLSRKAPLSEKISSAQMKTGSPTLTSQDKDQER